MGCWNETCFISHLPIRYGDSVMAFLTAIGGWELHRKEGERKAHGRDRASYVYPTDGEEPITLPIRATYNDYGSIEGWDKNDVAVRMAESLFNRSLDDILTSVMDHMSKDYGLHISKRNVGKYPVGFLMARENVAEKLIAKYRPQYDEWNKKYRESKINLYEQFYSEERLEKLIEKSKSGTLTEAEKATLESKELIRSMVKVSMFGSPRDELKFSGVIFREELHKAWKKTPESKREKLIKDFHELDDKLKILSSAMHTLRRSWSPSSGTGSQSFSLKDHIAFCDIVKQSALESFDSIEDLYSYMLSDYDY